MNKKILVLSVLFGFSTMSHASEPKYAFPQSDKQVVSKIKIQNAWIYIIYNGSSEVFIFNQTDMELILLSLSYWKI